MRRSVPWIFALTILLNLPTGTPAAAAGDGRPLIHEAVVDAPASEIWRLIATKDGMESWMVPHADVDFRVGGLVRTNHDRNGAIGDPKTITNRVLAVKPGRMFSLKVAKAPEGFPFATSVEGTWYEVFLIPLSGGRTRFRCVGHGFDDGPLGFAARAFVDRGNIWALQKLEEFVSTREAKRAAR